jgi:hypothetical protein
MIKMAKLNSQDAGHDLRKRGNFQVDLRVERSMYIFRNNTFLFLRMLNNYVGLRGYILRTTAVIRVYLT